MRKVIPQCGISPKGHLIDPPEKPELPYVAWVLQVGFAET